jgi:uncharacterized membrane protein YgaE (UPF0421/DUF939 family)
MANIANVTNAVAPSLPIATDEYQQQYQDKYSNVLRLYFNQLDTVNTQSIQQIDKLNTFAWMSLGTGIW